mmetsp:Transcript_173651/g.551281  ORF Transcript_173651/g.551281 Transcript_173651/m.551281 type:complete len:221 (+) Transcript_173651:2171-2833(+)
MHDPDQAHRIVHDADTTEVLSPLRQLQIREPREPHDAHEPRQLGHALQPGDAQGRRAGAARDSHIEHGFHDRLHKYLWSASEQVDPKVALQVMLRDESYAVHLQASLIPIGEEEVRNEVKPEGGIDDFIKQLPAWPRLNGCWNVEVDETDTEEEDGARVNEQHAHNQIPERANPTCLVHDPSAATMVSGTTLPPLVLAVQGRFRGNGPRAIQDGNNLAHD